MYAGFLIPREEITPWLERHDLRRWLKENSWGDDLNFGLPTGAEVALQMYLKKHLGLKARNECLRRDFKWDYAGVWLIRKTRNPKELCDMFVAHRWYPTPPPVEPEYERSDQDFANKLRSVGLTNFVFASATPLRGGMTKMTIICHPTSDEDGNASPGSDDSTGTITPLPSPDDVLPSTDR
ncbi:hypothetical protein DACRYDRAFT_111384 [Dacryopinax primogenitus]|uniref:Uncharacterized protein n=1 Tax=Dacryopinax primogenitus (strain DJM 731) TaxID=1858805 RepID=M5FNS3_DACPD|nr:uncharacterized protein DACRYDRAFT_111384 [Dacryopinax primogenitus]EJT97865.1 hypothetical protein DACRYDRAFT_111384 [Dacryopinax primogenitus]